MVGLKGFGSIFDVVGVLAGHRFLPNRWLLIIIVG